MSSKVKNKHNDEIDLFEVAIIIWKYKWKIFLISFLTVGGMFVYLLKQEPMKPIFNAVTEIRPISTYDFIEYERYNNLIENTFPPEIFYTSERKYGSSEEIDNLSRIFVDKKKFKTINKSYLMNLFIEKLNQNLFFNNSIKKFGYVKKEDFKTVQEYDSAVQNIVSTIKLEPKKDIDQILPYWNIKFQTGDKKNWEDFLKFLQKTTNEEVQKYLVENFEQLISSQLKFIKYRIEDIEIEISNTTQIEKVLKLERKKKIIQEDKKFMRIKDMFDNTPIVKSNKFYAANLIISSTRYEEIIKETNSKISMYFISGFIGVMLGIIYAFMANSFGHRLKREYKK